MIIDISGIFPQCEANPSGPDFGFFGVLGYYCMRVVAPAGFPTLLKVCRTTWWKPIKSPMRK